MPTLICMLHSCQIMFAALLGTSLCTRTLAYTPRNGSHALMHTYDGAACGSRNLPGHPETRPAHTPQLASAQPGSGRVLRLLGSELRD
jgi:hypothetical protein